MASEASISSMEPPGRSTRPIEPASTKSPANSVPGVLKVTWPGVWPGVWSTVSESPASSMTWPSASSRTSSGSWNSRLPKKAPMPYPNPANGSVSRCRSAGWT